MSVPKGFVNPTYEVRRWSYNGWDVGAESNYEYDGAGTIYVALQVARSELHGNPKQCWVCKAVQPTPEKPSGELVLVMIIPEIYAPPQIYVRDDGRAIVHGKDEAQKNSCKVLIEGWVQRPDMWRKSLTNVHA